MVWKNNVRKLLKKKNLHFCLVCNKVKKSKKLDFFSGRIQGYARYLLQERRRLRFGLFGWRYFFAKFSDRTLRRHQDMHSKSSCT